MRVTLMGITCAEVLAIRNHLELIDHHVKVVGSTCSPLDRSISGCCLSTFVTQANYRMAN